MSDVSNHQKKEHRKLFRVSFNTVPIKALSDYFNSETEWNEMFAFTWARNTSRSILINFQRDGSKDGVEACCCCCYQACETSISLGNSFMAEQRFDLSK
jgi:hypothetical protein